MNLLTAVDQDVEIVIRRKPRSRKGGRISVVASACREVPRGRSSTSWRLIVKRLVQVPRERAPKHARRSRQYITYGTLPKHQTKHRRNGNSRIPVITMSPQDPPLHAPCKAPHSS
jgi:hypothetical protein